MILLLVEEAVAAGARLAKAAAVIGVSDRTLIRWRQQGGGQDQRQGPSAAPANKLSEQERQQGTFSGRSPLLNFYIKYRSLKNKTGVCENHGGKSSLIIQIH